MADAAPAIDKLESVSTLARRVSRLEKRVKALEKESAALSKKPKRFSDPWKGICNNLHGDWSFKK